MHVTIYTKPRCTLCDAAKEVVLRVRARHPFELEIVDISGDAGLLEAHRYDIPVVLIDGRRAFKHRVDEAAFEARILR